MNFYKHHIGDFDADTAHLNWDEDAAYRRLICLYYRRERPIPSDTAQAFRLVRASTKTHQAAIEAVLNEFFVLEVDGWHNKRCDEEIALATARASTARANGSGGGRPRKSEPSGSETGNPQKTDSVISGFIRARGTNSQTPDSTTQTPDLVETLSVSAAQSVAGAPVKPPKKAGARLSKDWHLPLAWGQWAQAAYPHWPVDTVREIAQRFRDHWTAKTGRDSTKLDWEATWRNWCKSDITQRQFPPPAGVNGNGAETAYQRSKRERVSELTGGLAARVIAPVAPAALTLDLEP